VTATERMFPLPVVLTLTTGRFLCATLGELFEALEYLTGDSLMTHQLPRGIKVCGPYALAAHPKLRGAEPAPGASIGAVAHFLCQAEREHGRELPLSPLPEGAWTTMDPLTELADMRDREETP